MDRDRGELDAAEGTVMRPVQTSEVGADPGDRAAASASVRTQSLTDLTVSDSVRTEAEHEAVSKRFEMRLTASQLARWRAFAADQGVSLADLVRAAVDFAASRMPAAYVRDEIEHAGRERLARAVAETRDVRTPPPIATDGGSRTRPRSDLEHANRKPEEPR